MQTAEILPKQRNPRKHLWLNNTILCIHIILRWLSSVYLKQSKSHTFDIPTFYLKKHHLNWSEETVHLISKHSWTLSLSYTPEVYDPPSTWGTTTTPSLWSPGRQSQVRGKDLWSRSWWWPLHCPSSPTVVHHSMLLPRKHSSPLKTLQTSELVLSCCDIVGQVPLPCEIKFWTYNLDNSNDVRDCENLKPSISSQHLPFTMIPRFMCTAFPVGWAMQRQLKFRNLWQP
jgi:hypothetical protein